MSSDSPQIRQTPCLGRVVKKLPKNEKRILDQEIRKIISDPKIGTLKKGNLSGVRIHKFKINKQEHLLAYKASEAEILLIMLGSHENYYRELGKYLK